MNKQTEINLNIEFVDNGVILEYPDDCMKQVVEGCTDEPYNAIGEDIKQAISGIESSNRYKIEIKITAI